MRMATDIYSWENGQKHKWEWSRTFIFNVEDRGGYLLLRMAENMSSRKWWTNLYNWEWWRPFRVGCICRPTSLLLAAEGQTEWVETNLTFLRGCGRCRTAPPSWNWRGTGSTGTVPAAWGQGHSRCWSVAAKNTPDLNKFKVSLTTNKLLCEIMAPELLFPGNERWAHPGPWWCSGDTRAVEVPRYMPLVRRSPLRSPAHCERNGSALCRQTSAGTPHNVWCGQWIKLPGGLCKMTWVWLWGGGGGGRRNVMTAFCRRP